MQRLFSTFPNAWPGLGLLVLRLAAALSLAGIEWGALGDLPGLLLRFVTLALAVLLLLGFATPVAALGQAAIQVGIMLVYRQYPLSALIAAALGVGLAMLGPGAWSLDARMFGRKRLV